MTDYQKVLKDNLRKSGCHFERQGKGDHEIWYSPKEILNIFSLHASVHMHVVGPQQHLVNVPNPPRMRFMLKAESVVAGNI